MVNIQEGKQRMVNTEEKLRKCLRIRKQITVNQRLRHA